MKKIGILLSGRGSNFLAIANAIRLEIIKDAEIAVVLSNKEDAPGLAVAREMGLLAIAIPSAGTRRAEHDAAMISELRANNVDLVCLAGYMRIISPEFVAAFPDRILNVHPSLLPSFPGLEAQTQALRRWPGARCILWMRRWTTASSSCSGRCRWRMTIRRRRCRHVSSSRSTWRIQRRLLGW